MFHCILGPKVFHFFVALLAALVATSFSKAKAAEKVVTIPTRSGVTVKAVISEGAGPLEHQTLQKVPTTYR